jgi:hypothetical protein
MRGEPGAPSGAGAWRALGLPRRRPVETYTPRAVRPVAESRTSSTRRRLAVKALDDNPGPPKPHDEQVRMPRERTDVLGAYRCAFTRRGYVPKMEH